MPPSDGHLAASHAVPRPPGCALACILTLAATQGLAAEDYLDAIEVEAEKIDGKPAAEAAQSPKQGSRQEFEKQLEQHPGTFLFYKRLPARSQEEVFARYKDGAPIEEVRETIMDRFRHQR